MKKNVFNIFFNFLILHLNLFTLIINEAFNLEKNEYFDIKKVSREEDLGRLIIMDQMFHA